MCSTKRHVLYTNPSSAASQAVLKRDAHLSMFYLNQDPMRFTKISLLALALCFLFACSKEEAPAPGNELSGNWKAIDIRYAGTSTSTMDGFTFSTNFTGTGYDQDLVINFDESPNTYTSSGDYSIELSMNANGQTITQHWTNQGFIDGGSWSREGNELTISSETSGPQACTILELTESTLRLGYNSTQTTQQNGMTVTATVAGTYTFERQ